MIGLDRTTCVVSHTKSHIPQVHTDKDGAVVEGERRTRGDSPIHCTQPLGIQFGIKLRIQLGSVSPLPCAACWLAWACSSAGNGHVLPIGVRVGGIA